MCSSDLSDPVALGLCSQLELDLEVEKAAKGLPLREAGEGASTLLTVDETVNANTLDEFGAYGSGGRADADQLDADKVFAKLKSLKGPEPEEDEGF